MICHPAESEPSHATWEFLVKWHVLAEGFQNLPQCGTTWHGISPLPLQPSIRFSFPRMAEASCASVVRSARAVVADVGERAASKSAGLIELSNRSERNAERDCRTLLTKKTWAGTANSLKVGWITRGEGEGEDVPVLHFRDWCNFSVNGKPYAPSCWAAETWPQKRSSNFATVLG